MDQLTNSKIMTGNWVGSAWNSSPHWTPYAEAIADHYPIQVPLFLTTTVTLSGTPANLSRPRVVLTRPLLYDALIIGMSASQNPTIQQAGQAYLNIIHQDTGIPWVAPNTIGYAPLPAFAGTLTIGGFGSPIMSVSRLPEAFFLPKHTQLKLEWLPIKLDVTPPVTIILTMIGVQLINHQSGFQAPKRVTMPDGSLVDVGSRIPWFGCIPYGGRPNIAGQRAFFDYQLDGLTQTVSYTPPSDCDVEIHDTYASFLDSTFEASALLAQLSTYRTKIDDTRIREDWTPQFVPAPSVYGSLIEIDPQMPFVKPQLLRKDHKILMVAQSNTVDVGVSDGTVTFRGVRRCQY